MKKFVSILLAVMLVASLVVTASAYTVWEPGIQTSDEAIAAYEEANSVEVVTRKYYFMMPNGSNGPLATQDVYYDVKEKDPETGEERVVDTVLFCRAGEHAPTWYNDFTEGAGVYWWGSAEAACESWAGYRALVEDADQSIYYVNMPKKAVAFVWNNGIDGGSTPTPGLDPSEDIYYKAAQTSDVAAEYPDPGEYEGIPEGRDSFDGCIFIVNPDSVSINALSLKQTCGGSWYIYYGDGCYGMYDTDSANFKSVEENCCNPSHFDESGKHVGFQGGEPEPTVVRGDYDESGEVTIMDATRVQNILAKTKEMPGETFIKAVDADGDGNLTIMDATRIQNVLAKIKNMDGTPYSG